MAGTPYTLQILHGSDFEAGLLAASGTAKNFAAIVDSLEDTHANSITLASGDLFIPGPFNASETDPALRIPLQQAYATLLGLPASSLTGLREATARVDIAILNAIGVQASAVGNHDFDFGPVPLGDAVSLLRGTGTASTAVTSIGAQFPYLSANLDFSGEPSLAARYTAELRDASTYATTAATLTGPAALTAATAPGANKGFAPWAIVTENGERIGLVGLTTQLEARLTSLGGVRVLDPAGDGGVDNTAELAAIAQGYVDQITAQGVDKIVVLSHLQQYQLELDLATRLRGVDVIIAGGSHEVFANPGNPLRPGQVVAQAYPVIQTGADGNPVAVINTGGEYTHVGRLVVTFDASGVIDPASIDRAVSGNYATTDAQVQALWGAADPFAAGTRGGIVASLAGAVNGVIGAKDANLFGRTSVFLEGRRAAVRTQETNLGSLSADANLLVGQQFDPAVTVSFKNGGGIRAEIGSFSTDQAALPLPPLANPAAGKPAGAVSQLDIENSLRFNNALSVVSVTAANLARVFEYSAGLAAPGQTPGGFGQVGGVAFSYDPTRQAQVLDAAGGVVTAGGRVQTLAVLNPDGSVRDAIVQGGAVVGDPSRVIRVVTLSFIADGGDGNPLVFYTIPGSRTDLLNNAALPDGAATFAAKGSEQDALAEYLRAVHGSADRAYAQPETAAAFDLRVQDLSQRADTVLQRVQALTAPGALTGGAGSDRLVGSGGDDAFVVTAGRDTYSGGAGSDTVRFDGIGRGNGVLLSDSTNGPITGFGWISGAGGYNPTRFDGVERVQFADGRIEYDPASTAVTVQRLYNGLLGRDADTGGLSFFAASVEGGRSIADVARGLAASSEAAAGTGALGNDAFVQQLYLEVFGRAADAAGSQFWSGQLGAGAGRGDVAASLATSAEAAQDGAGYGARGVVVADLDAVGVARAYRGLLGRDVDAGGIGFWNGQIDAGATAADVARGVAASAEFTQRYSALSDADFVSSLYSGALGRAADADALSYWTGTLGAGASRADVGAAIVTSPEAQQAAAGLIDSGVRVV